MQKLIPSLIVSATCITALSGCGTESSTNVATENLVVRYSLTQAWTQDWTAPPSQEPQWSLVATFKSMDVDSIFDVPNFRKVVLLDGGETLQLNINGEMDEAVLTQQQTGDPDLQDFLKIFGDDKAYVAQLPYSDPTEATAEFYRASGEVIATNITIPTDQIVTAPAAESVYALGESFDVSWEVNPEFEQVRLRLNGCGESFDYLRTDNDGQATLDLTEAQLPEGIDSCDATLQVISGISFDIDDDLGFHTLSEATVERVSAVIPITIIR